MYNLNQLGWNEFFENQIQNIKGNNFIAARVAQEHKQRYILFSEFGELSGEVTGKLLYSSETNAELPKTGDWVTGVLFEEEKKIIINDVLERKTKLSRKEADRKTEEQIIASNIDFVFIVQSLDNNFNIRRLERYLTIVYESGARPVVILNKIDLNDKPEEARKIVENKFNVQVILTNAVDGNGVNDLNNYLISGSTGVFIGSSGVGKSTIINSLVGKIILETGFISTAVNKGKHTTTKREMILLEKGGIVIDTPGMRELQLWNSENGMNNLFEEIEELSLSCKFRNCSHTKEKGCAIIEALNLGKINESMLNSYRKLKKELLYLEQKQDKKGLLLRKEKEKKIHKEIKNIYKRRSF